MRSAGATLHSAAASRPSVHSFIVALVLAAFNCCKKATMDDAALPSPTSRRPLSYTPYQSHRRTNSQRSNASTPGPATPPSPAPVASFSSSGASSSSTILARPAPANNASSSSLRPSSTVIEPSPLRNSLPEPPPLRRLNAKPDKHTPAPAPTLTLQPAQPVAEREDDTPKATSPPPRSPARIDSPPLNGPPQRKAISTSQALRMRDHGRAAGLDSSAASTTSSDNTPRTQSPVPPSPATSAHPRIAYTQPRHAFQPRGVSRSQLVEFVEAKARVAKKKKSSSKKKNGVAKLAAQNGDEDAQRTEERIRRRVEKVSVCLAAEPTALSLHLAPAARHASLPFHLNRNRSRN